MSSIIIPELHNSKIRKTDNDQFSVLDVIRVIAGKTGHTKDWKRIKENYPDIMAKCHFMQFEGIDGKKKKKTPVMDKEGILYLIGLLPGEVGKKYREKAANLVRRYIEGDADLALEILYRDKNKERVKRAERRMQVTNTNKQVAGLVASHPGTTYSDVHNDRYKGLYRKNTRQLREECGAKSKETPLNYMSEMDLTLNLLTNQIAIRAKNPNVVFEAANNVREGVEKTLNEPLAPHWVGTCLPPKKARKELVGQMEIPLFND